MGRFWGFVWCFQQPRVIISNLRFIPRAVLEYCLVQRHTTEDRTCRFFALVRCCIGVGGLRALRRWYELEPKHDVRWVGLVVNEIEFNRFQATVGLRIRHTFGGAFGSTNFQLYKTSCEITMCLLMPHIYGSRTFLRGWRTVKPPILVGA